MCTMPKAFPAEFHADVVAVARKREAPISQVAKDFGISEATLHAWLKKDDIEAGVRPGLTDADAKELREYKNRVRLLEQENEILRRAAIYLGRGLNPDVPAGHGSRRRRYPRRRDLSCARILQAGLFQVAGQAGLRP